MTPEQIEFHRKRFEELCGWSSSHVLRKDESGNYDCYETGILFEGYMMAINNLEIPLAEPHTKVNGDYEWAYNRAIENCEYGIKSIGLKVKEQHQ